MTRGKRPEGDASHPRRRSVSARQLPCRRRRWAAFRSANVHPLAPPPSNPGPRAAPRRHRPSTVSRPAPQPMRARSTWLSADDTLELPAVESAGTRERTLGGRSPGGRIPTQKSQGGRPFQPRPSPPRDFGGDRIVTRGSRRGGLLPAAGPPCASPLTPMIDEPGGGRDRHDDAGVARAREEAAGRVEEIPSVPAGLCIGGHSDRHGRRGAARHGSLGRGSPRTRGCRPPPSSEEIKISTTGERPHRFPARFPTRSRPRISSASSRSPILIRRTHRRRSRAVSSLVFNAERAPVVTADVIDGGRRSSGWSARRPRCLQPLAVGAATCCYPPPLHAAGRRLPVAVKSPSVPPATVTELPCPAIAGRRRNLTHANPPAPQRACKPLHQPPQRLKRPSHINSARRRLLISRPQQQPPQAVARRLQAPRRDAPPLGRRLARSPAARGAGRSDSLPQVGAAPGAAAR